MAAVLRKSFYNKLKRRELDIDRFRWGSPTHRQFVRVHAQKPFSCVEFHSTRTVLRDGLGG
jgi:hypothetical protein